MRDAIAGHTTAQATGSGGRDGAKFATTAEPPRPRRGAG
jgi:hypothetical protein